MKAAFTRRYGPPEVVEIAETPRPRPKANEVLVKVAAAAVTSGDARIRGMNAPAGFGPILRLVFGFRGPRNPVQGMEFSGRVAEVGAAVAGWQPGQRVFGLTGFRGGAHAEYLCLRAEGLILPIPDSLTDMEAAGFFFGGLTATDFLIDKAQVQPRARVLINGSTGAVGSSAVQIARHAGAEVTAVCRAENHPFAFDLGARHTFDYRKGPLRGQWDVILDVAGTLPYAMAKAHLADGGCYLPVTASLWQQIGYALRPKRGAHRISGSTIAETRPAMDRLVALHQQGAYRPVIGATFPFADIRAAHASAGGGHKRGNCVVVMDDPA